MMEQRGGFQHARTNGTFCFGQALHSVRFHVEFAREFEVVVEFNGRLTFPIVVESFQLNSENGRQFFEARPLDSVNLMNEWTSSNASEGESPPRFTFLLHFSQK